MNDHTPPPPHQPVPRRSWVRRHKILTGLLAVLAIGVVGSALDEDEQDTSPSAVEETVEDQGAGSSAGSAAEADEPAAAESSAEPEGTEPPERAEEPSQEPAPENEPAPGVGDTVRVGDFDVTVTEVEPGLTSIGEDFLAEEPQGQFVVVRASVTNTGDSAEYFLDGEQQLIDAQDRQHSTSSSAFLMDEESLWLTEINPGNTVEGALLYDIPADASPVALDVSAGLFTDPVRISLD